MAQFSSGTRAGTRGARATLRFRTKYGLVLTVGLPDYLYMIQKRTGYQHAWEDIGAILEIANIRMATMLRDSVVQAFEEGRIASRRGVSTGRLRSALMNADNMRAERYRFGYGNPRVLDHSQAKYWRQIDEGYAGHVGRILYGAWGESLTGMWARSRTGAYAIPGPAWTGFGANSSGKFMPWQRQGGPFMVRGMGRPKTSGAALARRGIKSPAGAIRSKRGVILEPIRGEEYFQRGWSSSKVRDQAFQVLRQAVADVLGLPLSGVPSTRKSLRAFL